MEIAEYMYIQDLIEWRLQNIHLGSDRLEIAEYTFRI